MKYSYRFGSGSYISLLCNPLMDMGDTGDVGGRVGMFLSIMSMGALAGPPISGVIITATGGFEAVGLYAGSHIAFASILNIYIHSSNFYQERLFWLELD